MDLSPRDRPSGEIVIVDDDGMFRESLIQNLSDAGYVAIGFEDGPTALTHLAQATVPDIILLDIQLQGESGMQVLQFAAQACPATKVIVASNYADTIYRTHYMNAGAFAFFDHGAALRVWRHGRAR